MTPVLSLCYLLGIQCKILLALKKKMQGFGEAALLKRLEMADCSQLQPFTYDRIKVGKWKRLAQRQDLPR
jgi:hypothetical protein